MKINPEINSFDHLFIEKLDKCEIYFEAFEIYNEEIYDLLNSTRQKL